MLGIFNLANSEYKQKHQINEVVIVLSAEELTPGGLGQKLLLALTLDMDLIMVNQIMYTFHRQSGFLLNNQSGEVWAWHMDDYYNSFQMSSDYEHPAYWFGDVLWTKIANLL